MLPKSIKKTINIETISFPQIIKDHKLDTIDFLKMDCEGAEYEIFKGMKPEHFKKIKKIAMETHEIDEHRNRFVLKALLEKQGFSCQLVNEYLYAKR